MKVKAAAKVSIKKGHYYTEMVVRVFRGKKGTGRELDRLGHSVQIFNERATREKWAQAIESLISVVASFAAFENVDVLNLSEIRTDPKVRELIHGSSNFSSDT